MKMGKEMVASLKTGAYQHSALDVKMELRAPVILVPENVFLPHKGCLVLDVGVISVDSNLRKFEKFVDYKLLKSVDLVFDRYEVKLQDL